MTVHKESPLSAPPNQPITFRSPLSNYCEGLFEVAELDQLTDDFSSLLKEAESVALDIVKTPVESVRDTLRHVFKASGKKIRMILILLSGGLFGKMDRPLMEIGVACELLHLASLVHDDIIDDSGLRRNQESLNYKYNNTLSLLTGDFLFISALNVGIKTGNLKINELLLETTRVMIEGELLQLENRANYKLSESVYLDIINKKTAFFFKSCCELGGLFKGGSNSELELLKDFGFNLGMAFQIIDDSLDLEADDDKLGKPATSDLKEGSFTWPMITLRNCIDTHGSTSEQDTLNSVFKDPTNSDNPEILQPLIDKYEIVNKTREFAASYSERAFTSLEQLGQKRDISNLKRLGCFLLHRNF